MTSDDIKKVQIIATSKDGQRFLALSEDTILIRIIVSLCKFVKLKDDVFGEISLKDLMDNGINEH